MRKATVIVIVATALALGVWDAAALAWGGEDATISRVLLGWSTARPIVAFALGVLAGHLFWPQRLPTISVYHGDTERP